MTLNSWGVGAEAPHDIRCPKPDLSSLYGEMAGSVDDPLNGVLFVEFHFYYTF